LGCGCMGACGMTRLVSLGTTRPTTKAVELVDATILPKT
jgi:hypothetical protein